MNVSWERGKIPNTWKMAKVVMTPKLVKKLQLKNLRPILCMSCEGKLMVHMTLSSINSYVEDNGLLLNVMISYRPYLSAQDMMLRLKYSAPHGH